MPCNVEIRIDLGDGASVKTPRTLYDSRSEYRMRQVYVLKRLKDGTVFAYNRAYGFIGRAILTNVEFQALSARAVDYWGMQHSDDGSNEVSGWTGGPDKEPGEALWFDVSQK